MLHVEPHHGLEPIIPLLLNPLSFRVILARPLKPLLPLALTLSSRPSRSYKLHALEAHALGATSLSTPTMHGWKASSQFTWDPNHLRRTYITFLPFTNGLTRPAGRETLSLACLTLDAPTSISVWAAQHHQDRQPHRVTTCASAPLPQGKSHVVTEVPRPSTRELKTINGQLFTD
jgi:hypothetical protein